MLDVFSQFGWGRVLRHSTERNSDASDATARKARKTRGEAKVNNSTLPKAKANSAPGEFHASANTDRLTTHRDPRNAAVAVDAKGRVHYHPELSGEQKKFKNAFVKNYRRAFADIATLHAWKKELAAKPLDGALLKDVPLGMMRSGQQEISYAHALGKLSKVQDSGVGGPVPVILLPGPSVMLIDKNHHLTAAVVNGQDAFDCEVVHDFRFDANGQALSRDAAIQEASKQHLIYSAHGNSCSVTSRCVTRLDAFQDNPLRYLISDTKVVAKIKSKHLDDDDFNPDDIKLSKANSLDEKSWVKIKSDEKHIRARPYLEFHLCDAAAKVVRGADAAKYPALSRVLREGSKVISKELMRASRFEFQRALKVAVQRGWLKPTELNTVLFQPDLCGSAENPENCIQDAVFKLVQGNKNVAEIS